eukprot:s2429_g17.t1
MCSVLAILVTTLICFIHFKDYSEYQYIQIIQAQSPKVTSFGKEALVSLLQRLDYLRPGSLTEASENTPQQGQAIPCQDQESHGVLDRRFNRATVHRHSSPFANLANSAAGDKEWVEHLKKLDPDPASIPLETQALIDKPEKEAGRAGISNLYPATTHLKKAKKHLADVTEHKRSHKAMWMSHLASSIEIWEKQLNDFRRHQRAVAEQARRARTEINVASQVIQSLGHTAADGSLPAGSAPTTPAVVEADDSTKDKDEEEMRSKFQQVLKSCINSLGLDLSTPVITEIPDDNIDIDNEEKPSQKRQRALEPFGGSAPSAPAT